MDEPLSVFAPAVYEVKFRHAASHDFIYCTVVYGEQLIWEQAFFAKRRRYQRAAKAAQRVIADHQRALRILEKEVKW